MDEIINILFEQKIDFVIDAIDTVKTKELIINQYELYPNLKI